VTPFLPLASTVVDVAGLYIPDFGCRNPVRV
jgi:hypothetical protein